MMGTDIKDRQGQPGFRIEVARIHNRVFFFADNSGGDFLGGGFSSGTGDPNFY
jgi:hypothetical protein